MTYTAPLLTAANFRKGTLDEVCQGLDLSVPQASDAQIVAAVARLADRLDDHTADHFEVSASTALEVIGRGTRVLLIPQRIRTVTAVKIRGYDGTLYTQGTGIYRVVTSLDSAGTAVEGTDDFLHLIEGQVLTDGMSEWPSGPQTVQVTGTFGWAAAPGDIRRALALMVWDHFKPRSADQMRADRWQTADTSYDRGLSTPTGLPEADEIIARYKRSPRSRIANLQIV